MELRTLIKEACIVSARSLSKLPLSRPRGERVDLDRGCHTGDQADAVRYPIDPDTHRHALGKPYPREDRVNHCKPLSVWLCVRDIDAPRDAGDLTSHNRAVTQQFDHRRVAFVVTNAPAHLKVVTEDASAESTEAAKQPVKTKKEPPQQ